METGTAAAATAPLETAFPTPAPKESRRPGTKGRKPAQILIRWRAAECLRLTPDPAK